MKTSVKIISLITATLIILSLLVSCGDAFVGGPSIEGNIATVVLDYGDNNYRVYEIELDKLTDRSQGAYSLLLYAKENEGLKLDAPNSTYGVYINSIGDLKPDASKNEYVAIYTSVESDFSVPTADFPEVKELTYHGVTLKAAGVGISSLTVVERAVFLFRIETF